VAAWPTFGSFDGWCQTNPQSLAGRWTKLRGEDGTGRRGVATTLHAKGAQDKVTQAILRHSNVAVTQASYIKTLPESSVEAMQNPKVGSKIGQQKRRRNN
jgi:integrase